MYRASSYARRAGLFLNNTLRPSRKRLATLMIYATDLCDSACKHCLIWAKRPVHYLPKDRIVALMESACVTKDTTVGLEGGEFLLHPEALDIMRWFHEHHPNFDPLSNALKPDRLVEAVRRYPPQRLYLSLDGDRETYRTMRGKDGYDNVVRAVETLRGVVPISVMFTLSPFNDFDDLRHVAEVCRTGGVDLRVGIYNNIAFFDTIDPAHVAGVGTHKGTPPLLFKEARARIENGLLADLPVLAGDDGAADDDGAAGAAEEASFIEQIPDVVRQFRENYDFLVLYDAWRRKQLRLRCHSILDSLVVLPDGDVPLCQHLDLKLGNIYSATLDEIFNGPETQRLQHHYSHNCNACWVNFHRKYDIVLYRSLERFFPKVAVEKLLGFYQWCADRDATYRSVMAAPEQAIAPAAASTPGAVAPVP